MIAHLYEEYGEDFPNMLDGMFSFVLLDTENDVFMAARDHIGITPLYLGHGNDGSIWFASEMKCLIDDCMQLEQFRPGYTYSSASGGYRCASPKSFETSLPRFYFLFLKKKRTAKSYSA